jgi:hypothetical protein
LYQKETLTLILFFLKLNLMYSLVLHRVVSISVWPNPLFSKNWDFPFNFVPCDLSISFCFSIFWSMICCFDHLD